MLEPGSPAPHVVLEDTAGQSVDLAQFHGKQAVLLYFMRTATCAICNRHVQDLAANAELFAAAEVRVLIAVPENREQAAQWKAKRGVPFTVLTGRGESPHELIGLSRKVFGAVQQSGSVLIDAQGVVRYAHGATLPTSGYDGKAIRAAVAALRSTVMPGR